MNFKHKILTFFFLLSTALVTNAQIQVGFDSEEFDYTLPREYEIGGITVTGTEYLDPNVLIMISGLRVGTTIKVPGEEITNAIRKLWEQGFFEDLNVSCTQKIGNKIFLNIDTKERPRIAKYSFVGVKRSEAEELRKKIHITRGDIATDHLFTKTQRIIKNYYAEKGFLNCEVNINSEKDATRNDYVNLELEIIKHDKVKIGEIVINGNEVLSDSQVEAAMKETKTRGKFSPLKPLGSTIVNSLYELVRLRPKAALSEFYDYFAENYRPRIFKSSKFDETKYEEDKNAIIAKYNAKGYRDARIISDSVYVIDEKNLGITMTIEEGDKYFFRDISWVGNTKYDTTTLNRVLNIHKGDIYNQEKLEKALTYDETSYDISSLYMDDGYLFFRVDPVEVKVENDSIDLEIRIYEGDQARIKRVSVEGNTKTNDHVILREMHTKPGQLFSRTDVIRTTREMATLGYFNAETIHPDIKPDPKDGSVDINYIVEETSSDQIELSAGWGYNRLILTAGLSLNNFSLRNIFNGKAWRPIPAGDGQRLSFRIQTYGTSYLYYGVSFTEPWLGGRKPNALTVSLYQSIYTNGYAKSNSSYASFRTTGLSLGLGKRLKWPDDYFTMYNGINLMRYSLKNYTTIFNFGSGSGEFNVIGYNITIGRNSVSQPIYPRYGSDVLLSLEVTPPYSLISGIDYEKEYPGSSSSAKAKRQDEMYKWVEFHKWKFKIAWYNELADKLVLMTRLRFGYLGYYNNKIGVTPFQRFYLGGDGITSSTNLDGREIVAMRGYSNESLTPDNSNGVNSGGNIFTKYTMELRYPLSLNPTATIYALTFLEAGDCWIGMENFNPFDVYRSAGVGVRIYLPMFGMLGLDWGYGFDDVPGNPAASGSQFHFSIGGSID